MKINEPEFSIWAEEIINAARQHGHAHENLEKALKQAYDQGYHLGLNKGWAIEQDKALDECKTAISFLLRNP